VKVLTGRGGSVSYVAKTPKRTTAVVSVTMPPELNEWVDQHVPTLRPATTKAALIRSLIEDYRAKVEKARKR
jgi:predicted DNA-binding protein